MSERSVVVLVRANGPFTSDAPQLWSPLRWALSWAAPNHAAVELVLVRRRWTHCPDAEVLAVLDTVRAELATVPLTLRTITGRRSELVAVTEDAEIVVIGGTAAGLRRRDLRRLRCPWLVVAGGGVPVLVPAATGTRQERPESAVSGSVLPSVD